MSENNRTESTPELSGPKPELGGNLMGPAPTLLPRELDAAVLAAEESGTDPRIIAANNPASPLAWALLAKEASAEGDHVAAYAFARVGYHRGLDALRRSGWRGAGPIPSAHEPNRGFLQCLLSLEESAEKIGESDEVTRLRTFIRESDPSLA